MDPVDKYIQNAQDFAKPILIHLRKLALQACPDVEEAIKWNFPAFMYKGILCGMAAFKQHCTFMFWKGQLMFANNPELKKRADQAMGHFGRITKVSDLPADKVIIGYIREAMRLNDEGIKAPARTKPTKRAPLIMPTEFAAALKKNRKAQTNFEAFSYSHRKEYVQWISEAKREETKTKRIATSIAWLAEGKSQNWRYERC